MSLKRPRPGSDLRGVYDALHASQARSIELADFYSNNRLRQQAVRQLRDTYGLDVRLTRRGRPSRGVNPQWTLVGAWNGQQYVSYAHQS